LNASCSTYLATLLEFEKIGALFKICVEAACEYYSQDHHLQWQELAHLYLGNRCR